MFSFSITADFFVFAFCVGVLCSRFVFAFYLLFELVSLSQNGFLYNDSHWRFGKKSGIGLPVGGETTVKKAMPN